MLKLTQQTLQTQLTQSTQMDLQLVNLQLPFGTRFKLLINYKS